MTWLRSQRLSYSVGFTLADNTADLIAKIPEAVWTPAYDSHDEIRDGAWVAQLNGLLDLTLWPARMRVIARQERPHPGRAAANCPTSSCGTAAGPDAKTASGSLMHRADQPATARLRPEPDLVPATTAGKAPHPDDTITRRQARRRHRAHRPPR
jgi:hypothetical protein